MQNYNKHDDEYGQTCMRWIDLRQLSTEYAVAMKAVKSLEEAVRQGNVAAQYKLAVRYEHGQGVVQCERTAVGWYKLSADNGHAAAQYELGVRYEKGQGVEQCERTAVGWYRLSADNGHAGAQYQLGVRHEKGQGVMQCKHTAAHWYRLAADNGFTVAQYQVGAEYKQHQDGVKFILGEPKIISSWNSYVYRGIKLVECNPESIRVCHKMAAEGDAIAQFNLGMMYYYGHGLSKNYTKAVKWYQKSANQGYAAAQYKLGAAYEYGCTLIHEAEDEAGVQHQMLECIPKDDISAAVWYQKAADQGDALAQGKIGQMYSTKRGGFPNDDNKAIEYFEKALDTLTKVVGPSSLLASYDSFGVNYEESLRYIQPKPEMAIYDMILDHRDIVKEKYVFFRVTLDEKIDKGCTETVLDLKRQFIRVGQSYQMSERLTEWSKRVNVFCSAVRFDMGLLLPQSDANSAVILYRMAASLRYATAEYYLGVMYEQGRGVTKNAATAFEWYKSAAGHGNAAALFSLFVAYDSGQGIAKDKLKALQCCEAAANLGHVQAQCALGLKYEKVADVVKAITWYQKVANSVRTATLFDVASPVYALSSQKRALRLALKGQHSTEARKKISNFVVESKLEQSSTCSFFHTIYIVKKQRPPNRDKIEKKFSYRWYQKKLHNRLHWQIEVIAQEFFRLILPYYPKTRLAQDAEGNVYILSKEVPHACYFPKLNLSALRQQLMASTGLGALLILCLFLNETDLRLNNLCFDAHQHVIKFDGGWCFSNLRQPKKYSKRNITEEDVRALPGLAHFAAHNWLDYLAANKKNKTNENSIFAKSFKNNKNFRQEINETIFKILLLPANVMKYFVDYYVSKENGNYTLFLTEFEARSKQLRLAALQNSNFKQFLITTDLLLFTQNYCNQLKEFTFMGKDRLRVIFPELFSDMLKELANLKIETLQPANSTYCIS